MSHEDPSLYPSLAVSPEQLKLMSYGPRREIIAALANDADLSARQLADRLRINVTGLYRHLSRLMAGGLIQQSGQRQGQTRSEALYALTFATFSSVDATKTPEGKSAVAQAASRYGGASVRKFKRALENGAGRLIGDSVNTGFHVMDLQLDASGLEELQRLLVDFIVSARKLRVPDAPDVETVSVTIIYAPN